MNTDIPLVNWKRITEGLPTPKNSANDRAPTLEEIRKLIQYPDLEKNHKNIWTIT